MEFDAEPKMIGRDEELEELKSHLDRAAKGQGSTVFISGEAGIGKTRLVQELRQIAQAQGFNVLFGHSLHESLTPYMPFLDALRSGGLEPLFAEEAPKVEAVYLVTHGGLLIKEVLREKTELDPVLFASMLTAVGNFVEDSMSKLSGEDRVGTLSGLMHGDYRILLEAGKHADLVAVVTGRENEFLVEDMRGILDDVRKAYGDVLESWDGDEKGVAGIESLLRPLITSGKYDGVYYGREDPKARRNLLFENVSLGLVRHSQTTPTLLCIEDLQWADPSSLSLMHYVARNAGNCGLLMLGTYRPEDIAAEDSKGHPLTDTMQLMDREDLHEMLELQRLPADKMADFMQALLGEVDFDDDFMIRIHKETEGNPLFVIQLVKLLVEERMVARENGTWRLAKDPEEIDIPSKTYNVILRRLDRVEKEPRRVLDYASIIGDVFTSEALADALDMKRILLLEHLKVLEQTHRMIHPLDGGYRFDHAKIGEALYGEIPQELREEYHAVIAESIERLNEDDLDGVVEDLAFHYYQCRDNEKALHYLTRAAEKAKEEYSNEEAVRFYTQALEFEKERKKRREMYEALGDICTLTGEHDKSMRAYEKALECARENRTKAGIKVKVGYMQGIRGEYDDSIRILAEAHDLVRDTECREEARALLNIGVVDDIRGEHERALDLLDQGLRIMEKTGDQEGIAVSLHNIGLVHQGKGDYDRALEFYAKSLEIMERIGDQGGVASSLNNIGTVHQTKGDCDRPLEFFARCLEIMERIGNQRGIAVSLHNIGTVHRRRGEYDRALESYAKCLEIMERIGDQEGIAASLNNIGIVHWRKGEYDRALECHDEALETADRIGSKELMAQACICISRADVAKNDLKKALEFCNRAHGLSREIGAHGLVAISRYVLGTIHREQKKWKQSIENFESSIEILERIGEKHDLAESYYEFGSMWSKKGDKGEAGICLNKALKTFQELELDHRAREVKDALKSLDERESQD